MAAATRETQGCGVRSLLHLAFELGRRHWKLGFTTGLGQKPRYRTTVDGNLERLEEKVRGAKRRFGLPEESLKVSRYEAGRDGFWLHRYLMAQGIENHAVDSSSIEVPGRARRWKTDKLDLKSLLRLLIRYWEFGEEDAWSVVNARRWEDEDRRRLHRELETLRNERTERSNRIKSLLTTQGLKLSLRRDSPSASGKPGCGTERRSRWTFGLDSSGNGPSGRRWWRRSGLLSGNGRNGSGMPTAIRRSRRCAGSCRFAASGSRAPGSS